MVQHSDIDHTGLPGVGGGGGSLTSSEAFLTSNVNMPSADTYYDGPSLSLAAGTWLVFASLVVSASGAVTHIEGKLWDGTNVYHNAELYSSTAGSAHTITLFGIVVLGSTTTVKASAARDAGSGGTILDTTAVNGTADKASKILAVQIA